MHRTPPYPSKGLIDHRIECKTQLNLHGSYYLLLILCTLLLDTLTVKSTFYHSRFNLHSEVMASYSRDTITEVLTPYLYLFYPHRLCPV